MKLRFIGVAALLAVAASAQSIGTRDATVIIGLLQSIHDAMHNADNHLVDYKGGDPTALRQSALNLHNVLNSSVETAQQMAPLTMKDVSEISYISQDVTQVGSQYLADLAAAAPVLSANGLCDRAYQYSLSLGQVSNQFFTTARSKFPPESQERATQEIDDTNARFAVAQSALAPGACVDKSQPPVADGPSGSTPTAFPSPGNGTHGGRPVMPIPGSEASRATAATFAVVLAMAVAMLPFY